MTKDKMNVSIIAVGTELLFGQTVNTNATFLSRELNLMGFDVMYHFVVGDNPARLRSTIKTALEDTDMVILTGGLGPTQDDLTKETVAEVFGAKLERDEECYRELIEGFKRRHREMSPNNVKQADIPVGATVFHNLSGTAPGFALEKNGKHAVCFPGPPREMKWLYENGMGDYLRGFMHKKMYYRVIRTCGIGESNLETVLMPFIDGQKDPTIATYAKEGECTLRIASQRDTLDEAKHAVDDMIDRMNGIVGQYIYSYDNEGLNEVVVKKMIDRKQTLASAESCTGGKFAAAVTDVPGASNIFGRGFVTYSEEAKIEELKVSVDTIADHLVVSAQVAEEMAVGARKMTGSDIAVSVTGYAGPDDGPLQESGLAYIGYAVDGKSGSVKIETMRNDRNWNRNFFCLNMFRVVNDILDGKL